MRRIESAFPDKPRLGDAHAAGRRAVPLRAGAVARSSRRRRSPPSSARPGRPAAAGAAGVRLPRAERRAADPPDRVRPRAHALPRRPRPSDASWTCCCIASACSSTGPGRERSRSSASTGRTTRRSSATSAPGSALIEPSTRNRDALGDFPEAVLRRPAGAVGARCRRPGGVAEPRSSACRSRVDQFQGHWMPLGRERAVAPAARRPARRRPRRRARRSGLGRAAQVPDRHRPARAGSASPRCCPDGQPLEQLRALVRQYVGFEFAWDLRLILKRDDVPSWTLAAGRDPRIGRLGRTAWLQGGDEPRRTGDADDLIMNVESIRLPSRSQPRLMGSAVRTNDIGRNRGMSEISRVALFGKLNPLVYKTIEGATVFCKLRGNPYVELVHWMTQLLENNDSDVHAHRAPLRARRRGAGARRHRRARPPAARLDRALRFLRAHPRRDRARLGLRLAAVRRRRGAQRLPAARHAEDAAPAQRAARASRASSSKIKVDDLADELPTIVGKIAASRAWGRRTAAACRAASPARCRARWRRRRWASRRRSRSSRSTSPRRRAKGEMDPVTAATTRSARSSTS